MILGFQVYWPIHPLTVVAIVVVPAVAVTILTMAARFAISNVLNRMNRF